MNGRNSVHMNVPGTPDIEVFVENDCGFFSQRKRAAQKMDPQAQAQHSDDHEGDYQMEDVQDGENQEVDILSEEQANAILASLEKPTGARPNTPKRTSDGKDAEGDSSNSSKKPNSAFANAQARANAFDSSRPQVEASVAATNRTPPPSNDNDSAPFPVPGHQQIGNNAFVFSTLPQPNFTERVVFENRVHTVNGAMSDVLQAFKEAEEISSAELLVAQRATIAFHTCRSDPKVSQTFGLLFIGTDYPEDPSALTDATKLCIAQNSASFQKVVGRVDTLTPLPMPMSVKGVCFFSQSDHIVMGPTSKTMLTIAVPGMDAYVHAAVTHAPCHECCHRFLITEPNRDKLGSLINFLSGLDITVMMCGRIAGKDSLTVILAGTTNAFAKLYDSLANGKLPLWFCLSSGSCEVSHFSVYLVNCPMFKGEDDAEELIKSIISLNLRLAAQSSRDKYSKMSALLRDLPERRVIGKGNFAIKRNGREINVERITFRCAKHAELIANLFKTIDPRFINCDMVLRVDPRDRSAKKVDNTKKNTKRNIHYLLSHRGMHALNGNIDQVKQFTILTDQKADDALTWVHWNCGGLGKPAETLAQFRLWICSLPQTTDIISICELKDTSQLHVFQQEIRSHFKCEFRCYNSILTKDQQTQLHAVEIELKRKEPGSHFNSKGSHTIMIRDTLFESGQPFEHCKVSHHDSRRLTTIDSIWGFRLAYLYGPAQDEAASTEILKDTYLMSKEQFVNNLLSQVMHEHTLIMGDLNLKLNAGDDPANRSKAENLAVKVMEEKLVVDAFDALLPEDAALPPSFCKGTIKSRPDRLLAHNKIINEEKAFLSVHVNTETLFAAHHHKTLIVVFSPSKLSKHKNKKNNNNRQEPQETPPRWAFEQVISSPSLIQDLVNALSNLDLEAQDGVNQLNNVFCSLPEEHARKIWKQKLVKTAGRPFLDEPIIRKTLKKHKTLVRVIAVLKHSLRHWADPKPDKRAAIDLVNKPKWLRQTEKAKRILLQEFNKEDNIEWEVPQVDPDKKPPHQVEQSIAKWISLADTIVKQLWQTVKTKSDEMRQENLETVIQNELSNNLDRDPSRKIQNLKTAIAKIDGKPAPPRTRILNPAHLDTRRVDLAEKAKKVAEYWESIASSKVDESDQIPAWRQHFQNWVRDKELRGIRALTAQITVEEIRKLTKASSKSMPSFNRTPNNFFAYLFKRSEDANVEGQLELCRVKIAQMFNLLLEGALPPSAWREAEIVCLHKGGDPDDPGNYRPIALLASLNKLWTAVLTSRLSSFTEENSILSNSQRGGRPDMSTYQLIATLLSAISVAKKENKTLWILFLDLKKAYNSVPFWAIKQTLQDTQIPDQFVNAIMNLYDGLQSKINLQGVYSDWFHEERGVRQGDTLSPLLWILFLNPLLLFWKQSDIGFTHEVEHAFQLNQRIAASATDVSFVDDMAVFISNARMLQDATRIATEFFDSYGLEIGIKEAEKTAIMDIVESSPECKIQGKTIPKTTHYKYLGLPVSADLSQEHAFNLCKKQLQNAARLLACGPRFSMDQIVFLANQVLWPIVQYRTRTIQFTNKECESLNKIVRGAIRKSLHQFDYPNAMIHGAREHVMGALGIIDIAVQQRVDFLSATLNLVLNKPNLGQDWFRLMFHMSANNKNNNNERLALDKPHNVRMMGNLATKTCKPAVSSLVGLPQLEALNAALKDTGTTLVNVFDCFPDETRKLRSAIVEDRNAEANFIFQNNGMFATLKSETKFNRKLLIPTPPRNLTNQNSWLRNQTFNIFTFIFFNKDKPTDANYFVSLGISNLTQKIFCYKDERINQQGVALQAIERALLLAPQKVGRIPVTKVKIWHTVEVSSLLQLSTKQLKNHWHRNIIRRIQFLKRKLEGEKQTVEFQIFEYTAIDAPAEDHPANQVADDRSWLQYAYKVMLATRHIGSAQPTDMTPVLFSDPYILVKKETGLLGPKPTLGTRGMHMRAAILNQINPGELIKTLKTQANLLHKRGSKTMTELEARAKVIEPPAPNQRHLVGKYLLGTGKSDAPLFRKEARNFLTLRSNRQDTNARLIERKLPASPVPMLNGDIKSKAVAQPLPLFDPNRQEEYLTARKPIVDLERQAVKTAKEQIVASVENLPNQQQRTKELNKLLKKFDTNLKLWNRYKYVLTDKCNRCNQAKETTAHMFRDCPATKPFLLQMISDISQEIRTVIPDFTWQALWQDADGQIGTYRGDCETAYWLLLGYEPARLKLIWNKTKDQLNLPLIMVTAIRKARQLIQEQKKQADRYVYYALIDIHKEVHEDQPQPMALSDNEDIENTVRQANVEEEALFPYVSLFAIDGAPFALS